MIIINHSVIYLEKADFWQKINQAKLCRKLDNSIGL